MGGGVRGWALFAIWLPHMLLWRTGSRMVPVADELMIRLARLFLVGLFVVFVFVFVLFLSPF